MGIVKTKWENIFERLFFYLFFRKWNIGEKFDRREERQAVIFNDHRINASKIGLKNYCIWTQLI